MNNIFAIEAFKFSCRAFLKNIRFTCLAFVVSGLIFVGGLIASILTAALFWIPTFMVLDKIKEAYSKLLVENAIKVIGQTAEAQQAQIREVWGKFITEIFYNFPYAVVFAILGIFVLIVLMFVITSMLALGWMKISLNISDNCENKLSALLPKLHTLLKAICISAILILILVLPITAAFFMFKVSAILAGISIVLASLLVFFLLIKASYSQWFLIDKNTGIIESIKLSFGLKGGFRNFVMLFVLFIPIYILLLLLQASTNLFSCCVFIKFILSFLVAIFQYVFSLLVILSMGKLYRLLNTRIFS